LAIDSPA